MKTRDLTGGKNGYRHILIKLHLIKLHLIKLVFK